MLMRYVPSAWAYISVIVFLLFLGYITAYVACFVFWVIHKIEAAVITAASIMLCFMCYPSATMLNTSAKRATVSQRPTTVMY